MRDRELTRIAGEQFNRISRPQLEALGLGPNAIKHRVASGRLVVVEHGVFAVPPVLEHDRWGCWMGATLTQLGSSLSHVAAAVARGALSYEDPFISITRPGNGGPRRYGDLLVHYSALLDGEVTTFKGIPITTVSRTLIDIAGQVSDPALARAVRESVRLKDVTLHQLGDALGRYRGRRGVRALGDTVARYSGLPIHRAKSGAEIRALEVLRDARRRMPRLNVRVAGEEADLSWPAWRLIVEIDGDPFHQDKGEDARKDNAWREAGWVVRRVPSDDVYERPFRLLNSADQPNVRNGSL